ncbi:MAG: hypothetical protein A2Z16_12700 [Chloroflexi bacterium RBG_16_54_18]|nr:MAG: hypothetical protein A2Z16_12700 [Chloroflexi bacterium RBG_16_54_18]
MVKDKLHLSSIFLAIIGLLDSLYLYWVKITNAYALCGPIGDCESVNSSRFAEIAGIPIALLGAGSYLTILGLLLLERRRYFWAEYVPLMVFGLSLVGVMYSAYLTYVEVAILKAICPYCVISAIVLVILLALATVRLLRISIAQSAD